MGKNVIISTLPNISQNYLPKVNTSNIFANSLVYDNGTNVMVNTTTANTDYTGARLVVSNTSNSYLEVRSTAGQSSIGSLPQSHGCPNAHRQSLWQTIYHHPLPWQQRERRLANNQYNVAKCYIDRGFKWLQAQQDN